MYGILFKHLKRSFLRHTGVFFATGAVLSGTFVVLSLSFWLRIGLERTLGGWSESAQMSVYLEEDLSREDKGRIESFLKSVSDASRVDFLNKDQAKAAFERQMGDQYSEFLNDPAIGNPLPESFELHFGEKEIDAELLSKLKTLKTQISSLAGVSEINFGGEWIENYARTLGGFRLAGYLLMFVLLAGSVFVTGNVIRSSISARREEIEILELFGATRRAIVLPFIMEGVIMGGLWALVGALVGRFISRWQVALLADSLSFWGGHVEPLGYSHVFIIFAIGLILGGLGAALCIRQMSTGWTAAGSR